MPKIKFTATLTWTIDLADEDILDRVMEDNELPDTPTEEQKADALESMIEEFKEAIADDLVNIPEDAILEVTHA